MCSLDEPDEQGKVHHGEPGKIGQGAGISATATVRDVDESSGAVARALSTDRPTIFVAK